MTERADPIDAAIEAEFRGNLGQFDLDVSFRVPARGITALFGPSGSGKTTILRCMAGLTRLQGRLSVHGEAWQDNTIGYFRAPHRRPIGYVFQEPSLFAHLSVRRNLGFGQRRARTNAGKGPLSLAEVIDLLGLGHLLDRAPDLLSGGERQRVAIGRALLSAPRLLLMDEPLSALDRATKDGILPYLERVQAALSIPVLYVSHDISEVARLADHMVLLNKGKVVADGGMPEMLERLDLGPATGRFEAGVILPATVVGHDQAYHLTDLDHGGQAITLPMVDVPIGQTVRLRIRARDVALAKVRPSETSIRNALSGTVIGIAREPDTAFAETLIDVGAGRLRARVTRKSIDDLAIIEGSRVYALIKSISFDGRSVTTASGGRRVSLEGGQSRLS